MFIYQKKIVWSFVFIVLFSGVYYFNNTNQDVIKVNEVVFVGDLTENKIIPKEDLECKDCNLVIISLTNTRKDHLSIYGYDRQTTPNIDNFFKNSLIFENAFAPASWTLPVATSLYTSLFPYSHGIMDRYDGSVLSDDILTFTEILKENDYKLAGFTGGGDYNRSFNTMRGFDLYVDEENYIDFDIETFTEPTRGKHTAYLSIEKLVPLASNWLKENKNSKKFLLLQGFDTHCPFEPKTPYDKKFDPDYSGDIDYSNCLWTFEQTDPTYDENGIKSWVVQTPFKPKIEDKKVRFIYEEKIGGEVVKTWVIQTSNAQEGDIEEIKLTKEEFEEMSNQGNGANEVKITERDLEHMIALYDGEIAQADSYLEPFFKTIGELGLDKNTIFIFMAEHGDLFGEHGRFMRGGPLRGTFYDPVLNFPLLIKHPHIKEPIRLDYLMQAVDFMPTFLDILGLKDPQKNTRQGKNLMPSFINGKETNDYIYAASKFKAVNSPFFKGLSVVEVIRDKNWKLIKEEAFNTKTNEKKYELYELYNILEDPQEENNLFGLEEEVFVNLQDNLKNFSVKALNAY